jgi:hypothetical protein
VTVSGAESSPIALLARAAAGAEHQTWVEVRSRSVDSLDVALRLTDYEGENVVFDVRVERRGRTVVVREDPRHRRLPVGCPERHINSDGTFCLAYKRASIDDDAAASSWWSKLVGYLELQLRSSLTGRWPERYAQPHGEAAATQAKLEQLEQELPPKVVEASRGMVLRGDGHVSARRLRCPCGKKRQLRRCHDEPVRAMVTLREKLARQEREFWDSWKGSECCRSMVTCPLRGDQRRSIGSTARSRSLTR